MQEPGADAPVEYTQEDIDRILSENAQLKEQASVREDQLESARQRARESGAYAKAYERHKEKMTTDPAYAETVRTRQREYGKKQRSKLHAEREELATYREMYGSLEAEA